MTTPRLGDPIKIIDKDGKERTMYCAGSSDRRRAPWRRMKKHMAEQAELKAKQNAKETTE